MYYVCIQLQYTMQTSNFTTTQTCLLYACTYVIILKDTKHNMHTHTRIHTCTYACTHGCTHAHTNTYVHTHISHLNVSFFPFTVTTYNSYNMVLSASYSSYETMHPPVPPTKPTEQLYSQAQPEIQTQFHYQSLKETNPESCYTLPVARPHQSM